MIEAQKYSAQVQNENLHPLKHATSLEKHIIEKGASNRLKVEKSFFEYEKKLKFKNPMNKIQIMLVAFSILQLIIYPIVEGTTNFDQD